MVGEGTCAACALLDMRLGTRILGGRVPVRLLLCDVCVCLDLSSSGSDGNNTVSEEDDRFFLLVQSLQLHVVDMFFVGHCSDKRLCVSEFSFVICTTGVSR